MVRLAAAAVRPSEPLAFPGRVASVPLPWSQAQGLEFRRWSPAAGLKSVVEVLPPMHSEREPLL